MATGGGKQPTFRTARAQRTVHPHGAKLCRHAHCGRLHPGQPNLSWGVAHDLLVYSCAVQHTPQFFWGRGQTNTNWRSLVTVRHSRYFLGITPHSEKAKNCTVNPVGITIGDEGFALQKQCLLPLSQGCIEVCNGTPPDSRDGRELGSSLTRPVRARFQEEQFAFLAVGAFFGGWGWSPLPVPASP